MTLVVSNIRFLPGSWQDLQDGLVGYLQFTLNDARGHADPRTTQRYFDHLEVDDLEDALGLVADLSTLSNGRLASEN